MSTVRQLRALVSLDAKSVSRDALLRWIIVLPIVFALLFRYAVPALTSELWERLEYDLTPLYPMLVSMLVLLMPNLVGVVLGFLLLDQRDDRTFSALQVTPLSTARVMGYRLATPMVASIVLTPLIFPLAGILKVPVGAALACAFGAALLAPLYAFFLAAFAANKVQGFALTKAAGLFMLPVLVAWFVDPPWQLAFGILPTYWPVKLFWVLHAGESGAWAYFVVGIAYQAVLLWLVLRRFERVAHQ